MTVAMHTNC